MAVVNIKNPNRFINPNLLNNSYFVGGGSQQDGGQLPVNTRGHTSYASAVQYTIDRWKSTNANTTVALAAAGLTISGSTGNVPYLAQPLANMAALYGKKVTLSVLTTNGLKFATATLPNSDPASISTYASITDLANILYASGVWYVRLRAATGGSETFVAVKLELGDTQTLAYNDNGTWTLYEIPQYGDERMRCFRAMADSADLYSYNPNAPVWSTVVGVSTDATGSMPLPNGVKFNNLISVYQEKPSVGYGDIIAVPYIFQTTQTQSGVYIYGITNGAISLITNAESAGRLVFVYTL